MIRNILFTTFRFFIKHKAYSLTNVFGLGIGLATCIIIFLFVQDELSYDRFHADAGNIYRLEPHYIGNGEDSHWAASEGNLIPAMLSLYPEIKAGVKFHKTASTFVLRYNDKIFREEGLLYADSGFFDVFSFEMISGNKDLALKGPGKIILTESTARKYFGDEDPLGKIIKAEGRSYQVSGVIKDVPENSHMRFNMIISLDDLRARWKTLDQPGPSTFYSYIRLNDGPALEPLKKKVSEDIWKILGYSVTGDSIDIPEGYSASLIFNPITSIHLNGHAEKEMEANSDSQYIYIFSIVALFVLIIACINYMNLATARSASRAKEIGIKKVIGANRNGIFFQFMAESFLMTLMALLIALILVYFMLPYFNILAGKTLKLDIQDNLPLLGLLFMIWIVVSLFSGAYPAMYLSAFNPLKVLYANSGTAGKGRSTLNLRRSLVIFQFAISVLLIIGALTVYKQLRFISNKNPGFKKDQVIVLPLAGGSSSKTEIFKNNFLGDPEILSVCGSSSIPGTRIHVLAIKLPDLEDENIEQAEEGDGYRNIRVLSGDIDVVPTFGLEIAQGRAFLQRLSE